MYFVQELYKRNMDTITKWRMGQTLSVDEAMEILIELFSGADTEYVYQANHALNPKLYDLYDKFPKQQNSSNFKLYFSDFNIDKRPLATMSLLLNGKTPTHQIQTEEFIVRVYET